MLVKRMILILINVISICFIAFPNGLDGNKYAVWGEDPINYEFSDGRLVGWHYEWGGNEFELDEKYKIQEIENIPFIIIENQNLKFVFLHDNYFAWIINMNNVSQNTLLVSQFITEINNNELASREGVNWIYTNYDISASSSLVEGKIKYTPDNLLTKKYLELTNRMPPYELPWVEGVVGSGIDEKLELDFTKVANNKVNGLIISNGFVSAQKPDLYLKNNRVKIIKVKSINPPFENEYLLNDTPNPQYVKLLDYTSSLEITILDVYKGLKYDDTCINFIFGINGLK